MIEHRNQLILQLAADVEIASSSAFQLVKKDVEEEMKHIQQQNDIHISVDSIMRKLKSTPNWKSPGPDGVQGYWLKNLTSIHQRLALQLNDCLQRICSSMDDHWKNCTLYERQIKRIISVELQAYHLSPIVMEIVDWNTS